VPNTTTTLVATRIPCESELPMIFGSQHSINNSKDKRVEENIQFVLLWQHCSHKSDKNNGNNNEAARLEITRVRQEVKPLRNSLVPSRSATDRSVAPSPQCKWAAGRQCRSAAQLNFPRGSVERHSRAQSIPTAFPSPHTHHRWASRRKCEWGWNEHHMSTMSTAIPTIIIVNQYRPD